MVLFFGLLVTLVIFNLVVGYISNPELVNSLMKPLSKISQAKSLKINLPSFEEKEYKKAV